MTDERPSDSAASPGAPAEVQGGATPGRQPADQIATPAGKTPGRTRRFLLRLLVPVLAVATALAFGALVIVLSDAVLLREWTSDPLRALGSSLKAVGDAYGALLAGAVGNPATYLQAFSSGDSGQIVQAFYPISESLVAATPLIFTGLAVALGFRTGLFNIGAEGQLYVGAIFATFVGISMTGLPLFIHLPLAIGAGFLGGALWGFIPGILKARTGAHEVIVTIMLNYVSYNLVYFVLKTSLMQRPGRSDPISPVVDVAAMIPPFISGLRVHWGFALALAAAALVSWLLFRSTIGFEFRAVGLNPFAARYAGMNTSKALILTMAICGGLAGMAGVTETLGVNKSLTPGFSPGYGFDGIAIALLGGSTPLGVVLSALLFGALRAGATPMQAATGIPIDLVSVIQALVIMFVAAPAMIRALYRIRVKPTSGTEIMAQGWRA